MNEHSESERRLLLLVRGVLVILMLAGIYGIVSTANLYARAIDPANIRSFSVSGEGKVTTVPDIGVFTFGILTEGGEDLAALQNRNVESTNQAIVFLKDEGVSAEDITTEQFNISPRYQYSECGRIVGGVCPPPEIVGYTIRQNVRVKVRDLNRAGALIRGVVEHGANTVSNLRFSIDDPTMPEQEARAKAFAQAHAKAEALAESGGFRLGKLLNISEYPIAIPYAARYEEGDAAFGKGGSAPTIEPGSQDVRITLNLQYEIR